MSGFLFFIMVDKCALATHEPQNSLKTPPAKVRDALESLQESPGGTFQAA
jgi:hypothetical protein